MVIWEEKRHKCLEKRQTLQNCLRPRRTKTVDMGRLDEKPECWVVGTTGRNQP